MSTVLQIIAGMVKEPDHLRISRSQRIAVRRIQLVIEMMLVVDDEEIHSMTLGMFAKESDDEDRIREELKASAYVENVTWSSSSEVTGPPDFERMTINIIDPTGILKWLGIDLSEQFKKAYNDKPLRISAPSLKGGACEQGNDSSDR
jgi:hypothetical protein